MLGEEEFKQLPEVHREDRKLFWNYYSDGVCRLFYEAMRTYYHRFCTPAWTHVLIEVFDYDSFIYNDFDGKVEIPLADTDGLREFKLTDAECAPLRKKGKDCKLKVTIRKRRQAGAGSAVRDAWLVTVHGADQIPNLDKLGPVWCCNITGAKVRARVRGGWARSKS